MKDPEPIPMLDLKAQIRPIEGSLVEAVNEVLLSGQYILGERVSRFEQAIGDYLGGVHAVTVSSGTDALLVCLMSLEVGPSDEVLTSPLSFFATASSIVRIGARPVFADIDPDTFNLEPASVRERLSQPPRAVIPVHLYGRCLDERLVETCRQAGAVVIEDAAQAIGATFASGEHAGTLGELGCFSFYPTKNLSAGGDAGLVVTPSSERADSIRSLRAHGATSERYLHSRIGGNFRMDALQAAILEVKLPMLDGWTRRRRELAARYRGLLEQPAECGRLVLPTEPRWGSQEQPPHVYHQFVCRCDQRDALRRWLTERGIATGIYYPVPLHLQPCFASLGYREGDFPEAERACREVLALPIYPELSFGQQERVAGEIAAFYQAH